MDMDGALDSRTVKLATPIRARFGPFPWPINASPTLPNQLTALNLDVSLADQLSEGTTIHDDILQNVLYLVKALGLRGDHLIPVQSMLIAAFF